MSLAFVDPLSQLLLQLVTVLIAARLTGLLFARLGQSAVIGEIAAGILLGPSLLGWLAPGVFQTLFPASSLGTLQLLSQIGVCLFLLSLIHICRCRRAIQCRSRWSPYL